MGEVAFEFCLERSMEAMTGRAGGLGAIPHGDPTYRIIPLPGLREWRGRRLGEEPESSSLVDTHGWLELMLEGRHRSRGSLNPSLDAGLRERPASPSDVLAVARTL